MYARIRLVGAAIALSTPMLVASCGDFAPAIAKAKQLREGACFQQF